MEHLRFEWDENKNQVNKNKHGISFEEAKAVFYDEYAKLISDPDHSLEEERFILLGLSSVLRMLVVVHVYKEEDELLRIISARKATKKEITFYQR